MVLGVVGFDVAFAFFGYDVAEVDEDAGFVGVAEFGVHGSAEGAHGGREVHVGVDHGRDGGTETADVANENLVVFFVVAAVEETVEFVKVGLYVEGVVGPNEAFGVGEVFLVEVEDEVFGTAVHLGIHGDFAKEVEGFGYFEGDGTEAVPEVVERV